MALSAPDVLAIALARIQRVNPAQAGPLERWFAKHQGKLEPLAMAVARQHERSGAAIREESAGLMMGKLLMLLSGRLPDLHRWASTNDGMLLLLIRSAIEGLRTRPADSTQSFTELYPLDLPVKAAERFASNVAAIRIASRGATPTPEDRLALFRYTGNGGLSLERLAREVPEGWVPDTKAVVDEYYTMPALCVAVASTVAALAGAQGLKGEALEPSAGVGRFIGAFAARPDMAALHWTAVEYSKVSATICRLLYPFAEVHNQPLERWVVENYNQKAGKLALVVTNPPYGKRGGNKTLDPDKSYREEWAYAYFVLRTFDMMAPGGIGVALVPAGMLSGDTPSHRKLRERLLRRHHLLCAYRLPSNIYPGAAIVTDVSFWRARGGEMPSVLPEDAIVLDGRYFQEHPHHVLGTEQFDTRGRLQVLGDFVGLPHPEPRPECYSCAVTPYIRPLVLAPKPEESLSPELLTAHLLGQRIERYLSLAGSARAADILQAQALHGELLSALESWLGHMREQFGQYTPRRDPELTRAANALPSLASLLTVVTAEGDITAEFRRKPEYVATYSGPGTIGSHAEWLYARRRMLFLGELAELRRELGFSDRLEDLEGTLTAQGWCQDWTPDGEVWIPESDYYSGDLWPKLDRARRHTGERARTQATRLLEHIGVVTLTDAAPTPRDAWVPTELLRAFIAEGLKIEVPPLHWHQALLKPEGVDYADLNRLDERLQTFLGYVNHDMTYFQPAYSKQTDPETGEEESAERAKDRARLEYGERAKKVFQEWLSADPGRTATILEAYSRTFRGYRPPDYPPTPLPIARWGGSIQLKPHQTAGAWRLIRNNGGLLAFDVGVGKTLTGIATLAHLREIGRARRPLVIVPNSIIWKWHREITRALPDYRVVVLGSVRYLGRDGVYRSRLDEPAERVQKWNEFRLGLYDVALCTYSVFGRTGISEEMLRRFVEETPPLLRQIGMKAADLQTELEKLNELYKKRAELQKKVDGLQSELAGSSESDDESED